MSEAQSEFQRGLNAQQAGRQGDALSGFLMALAIDPEVPKHRTHALEVLGTTGGYTSLPQAVLDGLIRCSDDPTLDLQPLALVVRTLLEHNPMRAQWLQLIEPEQRDELESALADGALDTLLADPLTRAVLNHATNISLDLEDILTGLRRHALSQIRKGSPSVLLYRHRDFFSALAVQAERSDFAWLERVDETEWLENIEQETDALLVHSAYRADPVPERPDFPTLTPVGDTVSLEVQNQYVAFPYPRWERLPSAKTGTLVSVLSERFPKEDWPDRFGKSVAGLSAGCGTGRGALMLAHSVKPLALTAVDLSSNSLAFAQNKAEAMGLSDITFGLGDILELGVLDQKFDIIECSGVLHHMDDPSAGLRVLKKCLAPDGILRLALYSERARAAVVAARSWIDDESIGDTASDLRSARIKLRALPQDHPAKVVTETPEFFVLSGLHDLIFNVQEHRFTPKQLKTFLKKGRFRLLGFEHADPAVSKQYSEAFPDDPEQTDLDNWEMFEQNHPNTFAEMYQMWCRPIATKKKEGA